ncbi:hypothetical protein DFJ74DRAFT_670319 [Hyaloraphidium curvatum]|nr:hypothetical protein DFJ74DRAFT_670319 [Hyaloraphidium curvatum]
MRPGKPYSPSLLRLYAPLYSTADFLSRRLRLGDGGAFFVLTFVVPRIVRAAAVKFFIVADKRGWFDRYRIQKGRRVSEEDVKAMWEAKYGNRSWKGLLTFALPLEVANYLLQRARGFDIHERRETWWQFWKSLAIAAFVWDTFVWAAHVALHHPRFYARFHKQHHEFQAPMILVAEHFHPLDAVLEATIGAYLGNAAGRTSFAALWTFGMWRLWTVIHNHCGFELPWDLWNQVFGYVNYHDFHHQNFRGNYQTFFRFWDTLFGFDREYVAWQRKVRDAGAAEEAAKDAFENARVRDAGERKYWEGQ